jgi:hypothetical protein
MKLRLFLSLVCTAIIALSSCKKDDPAPADPVTPVNGARIYFTFKFDSTQVRLDNLGNSSVVPANHGAQSPVFHFMSTHYIEMIPDMWTALGAGTVVYVGPSTTAGGPNAINFDSAIVVGENQEILSLPLSSFTPGTYNYLRVSLAYQNYDVKVRANNINFTGRLASFIGYNTYISSFTPNTVPVTVNDDKLQGFWAFEAFSQVTQGQAPPGATTVPNPLFATSPIPQGSCVVTGQFAQPLIITGNETQDIHITISLSTNNSFEWVEHSTPGIYEPLDGDTVIDMGVRGMIPVVQ